jgi:hypothetical protein
MSIQYIDPLSRGFSRMKKALFHPFDLQKWLIVGFTAFLAGLTDCGGGGRTGWSKGGKVEPETILYFPQTAWQWLLDHPLWAAVIAFGVFLVFVFLVLISWLSARGKFMFLDNIAHNRAQVAAPWKEYGTEGNSLFLFTFLLGLCVIAVIISYLTYCFVSLQTIYESGRNIRALIWPAIFGGLGFFAIMIAGGFINLLLRDFVVPIIYRDRISASKAVEKFLPLLLSRFLNFMGYGLFLLCVSLMIVIGIIIAALATCCIGFIFLVIPYINSVILLPVSYTMRAFGVEFLEQFGPEYQIFPKPDINPPAHQSITA